MTKVFSFAFALIIISICCNGQDIATDTIREVTIHAYSSARALEETPAAIGKIDQAQISRFNQNSLVAVANTVPGVRMEERSPGSYRFSIRGSLLRSPFGVRNVKVYYNGLPLTDAGGNTYLNLLDNSSIDNMEIIKGPGGSIYGAGTGGVIILNSPKGSTQPMLEISSSVGSYGFLRNHVRASFGKKNFTARVAYTQQFYDGYRVQSALTRHVLNGDFIFRLRQNTTLAVTLLYTDLFYKTPGGLNLAEYNADPKMARPAAGPFKSAVDQHASVKNKTPLFGVTLEHDWNRNLTSRVALVGSHSDFENPAIRNYEVRSETNLGLRNENTYRIEGNITGQMIVGVEAQRMNSPISVYGNRSGERDTIQTDDALAASIGSVFSQIDLSLPKNFIFTAGASLSSVAYDYERKIPTAVNQLKKFDPVFSPRIAILKKIKDVSVFANASRGFSPPSLAEVRPSTNTFNSKLQAEAGWNYELGTKANLDKITLSATAYLFNLNNTIVIRHDEAGADYFVNAGKTKQRGIEASFSWKLITASKGFIRGLNLWTSYTINNYHFQNYFSGDVDLSGKRVTGVPPVVITSGIDVNLSQLQLNITSNYTDHIPLNDTNALYASEYFLLGGKATYKAFIHKHSIEFFLGIDNALDKKYSLGNDLNAAGGRYYNAAPGRNYFGGIKFKFGLR